MMLNSSLVTPACKIFEIDPANLVKFELIANPERDLKTICLTQAGEKTVRQVTTLGNTMKPFEFLASYVDGEINVLRLTKENDVFIIEIGFTDLKGEKLKLTKTF